DLQLDQNATFLRESLPERIWSKTIALFSRDQGGMDVEKLLKKFKGGLQVNQVKSSRLVEVGFESIDPKLSTAITRQIANQYLEELHRSKYEATLRAAKSVGPELEDLKNSVAKSGQDLVDFQKKHEGVALATQGAVAGDGTSDGNGQTGGNPIATR